MGKKSKKGQSRAGNKKRPAAGKSKANKNRTKSTGSVASKDLPTTTSISNNNAPPTTQPPPKTIVVDNNKENNNAAPPQAVVETPTTPAATIHSEEITAPKQATVETTPMAVGDVVEAPAVTTPPAMTTPATKVDKTPTTASETQPAAATTTPAPSTTPVKATPAAKTHPDTQVWDRNLREVVKNATPPSSCDDKKPAVLNVTPTKSKPLCDRALDLGSPGHTEMQSKTTDCGCVIS